MHPRRNRDVVVVFVEDDDDDKSNSDDDDDDDAVVATIASVVSALTTTAAVTRSWSRRKYVDEETAMSIVVSCIKNFIAFFGYLIILLEGGKGS